jgi:hypothetical protein
MSNGSSTAPARPPRRGFFGIARNLTLASIGIAGVLGDEAGALYRRSVERGGDTVQRVRERLPRPHRPWRRSGKPKGKRMRRSRQTSAAIEAALAQLNVPTAADMDALARQVAELEGRLDQFGP